MMLTQIDGRQYPNTTMELKQFIRDEVNKALHAEVDAEETEQSKRIHDLEHCLNSFLDFVDNPAIAGDSFAALNSYAGALCKKARDLLEMDE